MNPLVFVYGSLKQGFPNFATNRGTRRPGEFRTLQPYPLYLVGERHSAWLVDQPGQGLQVTGQVFELDPQALAEMDRLERITEPDGYRRTEIVVADTADPAAAPLRVQAYLRPPEHLAGQRIMAGPLDAVTPAHAALYRPRPAG